MSMAFLPLDMIEEPILKRDRPEDRDYLEESIRERGVLEPIVVAKIGNKYRIIDGHGRYLLAKKRGEKMILAKVVEVRDTKDEIILNLELNVAKKNFSIREIIRGIEMLRERSMSDQEIRRVLKLPKSTKYRVFWIMQFPPEIKDLFLQEKLAPHVADHIHKALNELGQEKVVEIVERASKENLEREELGKVIIKALQLELERKQLIERPKEIIEKKEEKKDKQLTVSDIEREVSEKLASMIGAKPILPEPPKEEKKDIKKKVFEEIREGFRKSVKDMKLEMTLDDMKPLNELATFLIKALGILGNVKLPIEFSSDIDYIRKRLQEAYSKLNEIRSRIKII